MPNAIIHAVTLRIDKYGRIVIPRSLRDRLGFTPESEIEAVEQGSGGVLLTAKQQQPAMVKVDGRWVHHGTPDPGTDWSKIVDLAREERLESTLGTRPKEAAS